MFGTPESPSLGSDASVPGHWGDSGASSPKLRGDAARRPRVQEERLMRSRSRRGSALPSLLLFSEFSCRHQRRPRVQDERLMRTRPRRVLAPPELSVGFRSFRVAVGPQSRVPEP
eukprot:1974933-Alexandrium_andersonii.AAC.1